MSFKFFKATNKAVNISVYRLSYDRPVGLNNVMQARVTFMSKICSPASKENYALVCNRYMEFNFFIWCQNRVLGR
jgi:hypothetical protein